MLLEELAGKNANLRQAVHPLMDFYVDVNILNLVEESIMLDDALWENRERHLHIFIPVK